MNSMSTDELPIQHVSDTASWVAYYRAIESERPDAIFHDPLAKRLMGSQGQKIAESMKKTLRYSQWSVVVRTYTIDRLIQKYVADGVDTVVNLGAGLDTRPYRLDLPKSLRWFEVDFPEMIEHKERLLGSEGPRINLERIRLDLSNRSERQKLFSRLGSECKTALILTEGVIPYLTEDQVATLAKDLHAEANFSFWIAEWYSSRIYRHLRTRQRMEKMKNAPFQFFPTDWFDFFKANGWGPREICYLSDEGRKVNRPMPLPWWAKVLFYFARKETIEKRLRQTAYVVFGKV